jgi:hypothetical protein
MRVSNRMESEFVPGYALVSSARFLSKRLGIPHRPSSAVRDEPCWRLVKSNDRRIAFPNLLHFPGKPELPNLASAETEALFPETGVSKRVLTSFTKTTDSLDNLLDNAIADSNVYYCTAPLETKEGQDDGLARMAVLGGGPAMLMEVPFPAVPLPCFMIRRHVPRSRPDRDGESYFSCPVGEGNPDMPSVLRRASCGARAAPTDKFRSR